MGSGAAGANPEEGLPTWEVAFSGDLEERFLGRRSFEAFFERLAMFFDSRLPVKE